MLRVKAPRRPVCSLEPHLGVDRSEALSYEFRSRKSEVIAEVRPMYEARKYGARLSAFRVPEAAIVDSVKLND
jgi:hypothetical protein